MPVYDFYAHPPTTKAHVHEYITTWLSPVTDTTPVTINGARYRPISGFRRGSCIHTIYQNLTTGDYVWYMADDSVTDYAGWPTKSYRTLDSLLENVVTEHCQRWGIPA